jgi:YHS domain-containing protein
MNSADAATLHWRNNLQEAAMESQRLNKPMLIEISAVWCRYCKKMKRTFADAQVIRQVNGCFIPVEIDADKNQRLVEAVGADALPTTVIISSDFKLLKKIVGYHTPAQLNRKLGEICQVKYEIVVAEKNAKPPKNVTPMKPVKKTTPKPAFDRYCLVSLLDNRKLKQCTDEHAAAYKGRVVYFANDQYKRRFEADPEKYWPAYDGNCPVTTVDKMGPAAGKAAWGAIYHHRLWFFANKASRAKFAASPKDYASPAEQ